MASVLEGSGDGVGPVLWPENTLGIGVALELDLRLIGSLEVLGAPGLGLWGFRLHRLLFFVVFAEHAVEESAAVMGTYLQLKIYLYI